MGAITDLLDSVGVAGYTERKNKKKRKTIEMPKKKKINRKKAMNKQTEMTTTPNQTVNESEKKGNNIHTHALKKMKKKEGNIIQEQWT